MKILKRSINILCFLFTLTCTSSFAYSGAADLNDIIEAAGGQEAYDALPVLDLGSRCGSTGYLDFVRPNMMSHNVMKGVDAWERPFVAFKWVYTYEYDGQSAPKAAVLFQRYPDISDNWSIGCIPKTGIDKIIRGLGGLSKDEVAIAAKLIRGEIVKDHDDEAYKLFTEEASIEL